MAKTINLTQPLINESVKLIFKHVYGFSLVDLPIIQNAMDNWINISIKNSPVKEDINILKAFLKNSFDAFDYKKRVVHIKIPKDLSILSGKLQIKNNVWFKRPNGKTWGPYNAFNTVKISTTKEAVTIVYRTVPSFKLRVVSVASKIVDLFDKVSNQVFEIQMATMFLNDQMARIYYGNKGYKVY